MLHLHRDIGYTDICHYSKKRVLFHDKKEKFDCCILYIIAWCKGKISYLNARSAITSINYDIFVSLFNSVSRQRLPPHPVVKYVHENHNPNNYKDTKP